MIRDYLYPCIPLVVVVLFISLLCLSAKSTNESTVIKRYSGQTIRKLEFEGHYYLVTNSGEICHDENCKCKK